MESVNLKKVVIWGYPLHSHTHSYIHYGWVKAFKYLGFATYWFHDKDYPNDTQFDYENTLFITEGYADNNIPLKKSSIYFVHICINPEKYYSKVQRFFDVRYLVNNIKDCNYDYVLDKTKCSKISEVTYYDIVNNTSGLTKHKNNPLNISYEIIYICWATDLLPNEINFDWINCDRTEKIYYIGSLCASNENEINKFK